MTDDRMDMRLQAAGARWRDDHAEAASGAVDETVPEDLTHPRPGRRRIGLWASVAAVAAVFVAGGVVTLANLGGGGAPAAGRGTTSAPGAPPTLEGSWTLTRVVQSGGNSGGTTAGSNLGVSVTFAAQGYRIHGLCTNRAGTYVVVDDQLTITPGSTTYCLDPREKTLGVADVFGTAGTVRYAVDRATLTLARGGTALSFQRAGTGGPQPSRTIDQLAGSWRLLSAETNDGNSSSGSGSSDSPYRLQFSGGGYVITAGCPTTGTYVGNDSQLTLTLNEAQPACGGTGNPSQVDTLVQTTLKTNGSVGWRIAGSMLVITRGDTTLTFVRTK